VQIPQKCDGTRYTKLVFLDLVGSTSEIVHSIVARPQNIDVLFFILMWALCGSHRKRARTGYVKPVFLHSVQSADHIVRSCA
jgi:hypothetical protein